jgi:hypothetical protein
VAISAFAPGIKVMRAARPSTSASVSPPSSETRSFKAPTKSISPFIARAVIAAIAGLRPRSSASSSSISWWMIVDSMSATSSRLRRFSTGWVTQSIAASPSVRRLARRQPVARLSLGPQPGQRAAGSVDMRVRKRAHGRTDQSGDEMHGKNWSSGKGRCAFSRAASIMSTGLASPFARGFI